MGYGYGYDPARSTEMFPEAHPVAGVAREQSSARTIDPEYPEISPPQHTEFPVPAPAGGLRVGAGPYGLNRSTSPATSPVASPLPGPQGAGYKLQGPEYTPI